MDSNTTELCCPLYQCGESRRDVGHGRKGLLGPVCVTGPFTESPSHPPTPRTLMVLPCPSLHCAFITKALYLPRRKYKIQVKILYSCLPGILRSTFPSVPLGYSLCLYVCVLYQKDATWTYSFLPSCEHVTVTFPR